MIPQNPGAQNDPNVQLQNLQNAQGAIAYFRGIIAASEDVMASLRELEDSFGVGDVGLRNEVQEAIKNIAMQTPAFNILAQMNFVSSVDNILDSNQLNNVEVIINNNIGSIQSGAAQVQPASKAEGAAEVAGQMGYQSIS